MAADDRPSDRPARQPGRGARAPSAIGIAVALSLAVLAWLGPAWLAQRDVRADGMIHVLDGDSLLIDGRVADLFGIDAPELGQICLNGAEPWRCGEAAAFALAKRLTLAPPSCRAVDPATGAERGAVADAAPGTIPSVVCKMAGEDLAEAVLHDGYAVALADTFPSYAEAQAVAEEGALGIWRGAFARPADWLPDKDRPTMLPCPVKSLTDPAGSGSYVVPTDAGYDKFEGGQRYCSDLEARAAGLHHAGEAPPR